MDDNMKLRNKHMDSLAYIINGNEFKKIIRSGGNEVFRGYDKTLKAWVKLFRRNYEIATRCGTFLHLQLNCNTIRISIILNKGTPKGNLSFLSGNEEAKLFYSTLRYSYKRLRLWI